MEALQTNQGIQKAAVNLNQSLSAHGQGLEKCHKNLLDQFGVSEPLFRVGPCVQIDVAKCVIMDTFVIFAFVLLCVQVAFRQAYKDQQLDSVSKLLFLELIELRSSQWVANEAQANYYRQKLNQIDPALLQSGESLR